MVQILPFSRCMVGRHKAMPRSLHPSVPFSDSDICYSPFQMRSINGSTVDYPRIQMLSVGAYHYAAQPGFIP